MSIYLADQHVMLVFRIQTTEGALPRVGGGEESFSEAFDTMTVIDLSQMTTNHLSKSESIQKLVPEQNVFSTQLRDITETTNQRLE